MRATLYQYADTPALTKEILEWVANPDSHGCTDLAIYANSSLEPQACEALVNSAAARTIEILTFHEIYCTPEVLQQILTMPAVVNLEILGGMSQDWGGMEFIFPTLEMEHIEVLKSGGSRLRTLSLYNQNFSESLEAELRQALPNLQYVTI